MSEAEELITIARIARTRGLRGELLADLLTDFPERFDDLAVVVGLAPDGTSRSLQIEEHWFHGHRLVLKFAGYDSIDAAKELAGFEIAVPVIERVPLPPGQYYEWELVGCRVERLNGEVLGEVSGILRTGAVEVLTVVNQAGREFLIPMAQDICVEIDVSRKLIRVDPPAGLLEL